jgi:hypothetical protein
MLVMVALVMAAMMLTMAMPAFATKVDTFRPENCGQNKKVFDEPPPFTTFSASDDTNNDNVQVHDCQSGTPTE